VAGRLSGTENEALVSRNTLTSRFAGATLAIGKDGHRELAMTGTESGFDCDPVISQRCSPVRRQQDGSCDDGSEAESAGITSEELKMSDSKPAKKRRTVRIVYSSKIVIASRLFKKSANLCWTSSFNSTSNGSTHLGSIIGWLSRSQRSRIRPWLSIYYVPSSRRSRIKVRPQPERENGAAVKRMLEGRCRH
jgi:hypothetical protein